MNWRNVKTIFHRELRDQLRDRRTMFMIAVLPILLYPLLGLSFLQVAQFLQDKPSEVLVVGGQDLHSFPPLLHEHRFAPDLFADSDDAKLLLVAFPETAGSGSEGGSEEGSKEGSKGGSKRRITREEARDLVRDGKYHAVVWFPPDFGERLQEFHERLLAESTKGEPPTVPNPEIIFTTASDRSRAAFHRVRRVLAQWSDRVGQMNLEARGIRIDAADPFDVRSSDLAIGSGREGIATWSKILPVMLLLWALTGAFYPAVDLCAGEKERGTLETLLSSPAERTDIVLGKLLTVILFSAATAVLNLLSIALTSRMILAGLPGLGSPPWGSAIWLLLMLIPMSALFSALCLALAAFARSSKEGQYYLMPLLIVTMPLVVLPMAPGVELDLAHSLIPVTGVVLLLKSLLEGSYMTAARFALPVLGVTFLGCFLAVRWAIDQFNEESVLFRETERLDLRLWFKRSFQERKETPTVAAGVFGGILILVVGAFLQTMLAPSAGHISIVRIAVFTQVSVILAPTVIMTILTSRSFLKTLLIRKTTVWACFLAVILAVALHPLVTALVGVVMTLYPIRPEILEVFEGLRQAPFLVSLGIGALLPAFCEELAFRGFVLSGCRHTGHTRRAIVVSALFFGASHMVLQQSIVTFCVGLVIGYIAVRTKSIFPCMLFHLTHNTLGLVASKLTPELIQEWSLPAFLIDAGEGTACPYNWPVILCGAVLAACIWQRFAAMPIEKTEEEARVDAVRSADHRRRVLELDEE